MKIQQWKFNNENLTMKSWQWKWQQWKFDNENSDNENLTMKMQQWKCQQWKTNNEVGTMKSSTMKMVAAGILFGVCLKNGHFLPKSFVWSLCLVASASEMRTI